MGSVNRFLFCAGGIFVCYFCFGILQEKIVRGQYVIGDKSEKFTYMFSLVLSQCTASYLLSKLLMMTLWKQGEDTTKNIYYACCSLTFLLAMVSSNMALQFVSYPTQVVGKAAKPIPVLIMGVLLAKKSYPIRKYFFILLVVVGLIMFIYKDPSKLSPNQKTFTFGFGELLIGLSLLMDGLTTSCQEHMKTNHQTKSLAMMCNVNFWSCIYSLTIIIFTGELVSFLSFLQRHPSCISLIILFSLTGAVGHYFIYATVTEFGPLPCAIVTTTRKFFTMLASIIIFGNTLLTRQWIASVIIFLGLFLDLFYGKSSPKKEVAK